jgi:hypothetical protein
VKYCFFEYHPKILFLHCFSSPLSQAFHKYCATTEEETRPEVLEQALHAPEEEP